MEKAFLRASTMKDLPFPLEVCKTDAPVKPMPLFHWHEYWELTMITRGRGVYEVERETMAVRAGDLVVINPGQRHRLSFSAENPLYETVIHFEQRLLNTAALGFASMGAGIRLKNLPFPGGADLWAPTYRGICEAYGQGAPYYEWVVTGQLYALFAILLQNGALQPVSPKVQQRQRRAIARLERILDYIRAEAANDVKMRRVAEQFYMNPTYFSEYFKAHMGVTFREYLSRLRVSMAVELMGAEDLNAAQIAQRVGYGATTGFYHAFRRVTGRSPSEYMKRNIKKGDEGQ